MAKPVNCRYFYGDYHRGANREKCRLLEANPNNSRPWRRKLCESCPVPEILLTSNCRDLLLEAEVTKGFLRERVVVSFAVCSRHMLDLEDPHYCPRCAEESS